MTQQRVKKYVGGQAVIEGVMMRGPKIMATACRKPDGTITVKDEIYPRQVSRIKVAIFAWSSSFV